MVGEFVDHFLAVDRSLGGMMQYVKTYKARVEVAIIHRYTSNLVSIFDIVLRYLSFGKATNSCQAFVTDD